MIQEIHGYNDLQKYLQEHSKIYLLLYKPESAISDCAMVHLEKVMELHSAIVLLKANVKKVRDIHEKYGIKTVPTLMQFENGEYVNAYKGCHDDSFYASLFKKAIHRASLTEDGAVQKHVTVYSTPSCSWCTTLKTYLDNHGIYYTDVDISRNPAMAQELVNKSGQQGVPQTEIDGEIVVGFDKVKINRLLDIKG